MRHQSLTTLGMAASIALAAACSPDRISTVSDGSVAPRFAGSGVSSNPLLTWLPPMADNPGPYAGEFDGSHDFTLRVACVCRTRTLSSLAKTLPTPTGSRGHPHHTGEVAMDFG